MNKKIAMWGIALLLVIGTTIPMVNAYFPKTHSYIIHETCEKRLDTDLAKMCCNEEDACIAGNILADISVIYYLERGLKKYTITHSSILCKEAIAKSRTPTEEAVAAGMCLHMIQDVVSHNKMVPYSIRKTGLPNNFIHPFSEQKLDNYVESIDPNAGIYVQNAMEGAMEYVPFIQRILQPNPEYGDVNVETLTKGFIEQVKTSKTGYDVSFNTVKAIPKLLFVILGLIVIGFITGLYYILTRTELRFINIISAVIMLVLLLIVIISMIGAFTGSFWVMFTAMAKPISILTPIPDPGLILQDTLDETKNMMIFGATYLDSLPPEMRDVTGLNTGQIKAAEMETRGKRIFIYAVILLIIGFMIYLNFRTRKKT